MAEFRKCRVDIRTPRVWDPYTESWVGNPLAALPPGVAKALEGQMACQTCDHSVHKVGVMPPPYTEVPLFWCPRCGTLRANVVNGEDESPKLVERLRAFVAGLPDEDFMDGEDILDELRRLGILESLISLEGSDVKDV